jgi:hypothetical protein
MITAGKDGRIDSGIWRWFTSPQDLSGHFISLYLWGAGRGGFFQVILASDEKKNSYNDIGLWVIPDDFAGWQEKVLSIDQPSQTYGKWNASDATGILLRYNAEGLAPEESLSVCTNRLAIFTPNVDQRLEVVELGVLEISPTYASTRYVVETRGPSCLVFLQNYDSGWNAYAYGSGNTTTALEHVRAFDWANGFRLSAQGRTRVLLIYKPQAARDMFLLVWALAAPLTVLCLAWYETHVKIAEITDRVVRYLTRRTKGVANSAKSRAFYRRRQGLH